MIDICSTLLKDVVNQETHIQKARAMDAHFLYMA